MPRAHSARVFSPPQARKFDTSKQDKGGSRVTIVKHIGHVTYVGNMAEWQWGVNGAWRRDDAALRPMPMHREAVEVNGRLYIVCGAGTG